MTFLSRIAPQLLTAALSVSLFAHTAAAQGHSHGAAAQPQGKLIFAPTTLGVNGKLAPAPAGVTDLKFSEMFRMPVGPQGLEATDKLQSLNGQRVRLVGYMVTQDRAYNDFLILTPTPVMLGDEDESLSDDLPVTSMFVHLAPGTAAKTLPNVRGLMQLTGTLRLGSHEEPDGHVSSMRLELDVPTSKQLAKLSLTAARH
jgi:hypothetical protein